MKGRIDKVEGGKVRMGAASYAYVSRTMGVYITTSGGTASGSVSGQHVTEYSISVPGKSYTFNYWRPSSATQVCIAFLDANNTLLDAVYGGSSGQTSGVYTTPAGCTKVRIYGIYRQNNYVYATMTPTVPEGSLNMVEIKVRRPGTNFSQVVWPTVTTYRITNARLVYSGSTVLAANGGDFAMAYGDIEATLGTQTTVTRNVVLTPLRITPNDHLVIDGVDQQIYSISGNRVLAKDLKTAYAPYGTATTVIFGYMGQEVPLYVQQRRNIVESSGLTNKSYTGYRIELNNTDFTPSGGSATVTGYAQFTARPYESWTSGAVTYGSTVSSEEEQTPGSISVSPSGATISGTTITFPANTGSSEKVYTVTGRWSSYTATEYAYVYGTDTGKTYTDLRITSFDYPNSRIIPASGGSMYPTVAISIKCNGTTMTGSVSDGSTVCEVSGGGMTATVNLAYSGAPNGFVSANSLGTNETSSATLLASVSVTATKGSLSATSATRNVSQERNVKSVYSQGTYSITSMSVTPKIGSTAISGAIPAKSATVTLEILVSGSGTTTRYRYTSGAYSGGDTVSDTDKSLSQADLASLSVVISGGSAVTVSNLEFTASNQHNLTDKTYDISATYEGTTRTASVQQAADTKENGSATPYVSLALSSNNITAGGGYVDIIATARSTAGKVWASDGTPVSGESSTIDNTSSVLLDITQSSQGAFPSVTPIAVDTTAHTKTFRIAHRDMTNNVTIDSLSVVAKNGTTQSSALQYSVSNALETTEYEEEGTVVWGTTYTEIQEYIVALSIGAYTSPDSPAPSNGGSTTYSVSARHRTNDYRDGTVTINYYRRYTSWSAEKDDASHKELVRTEYDTTTYAHQFVPNSQRIVTGDSAAISVVGGTPSWLQITPTDATHGTIQFSAQSVDNAVRYVTIRATHADDDTAYAQSTVWQQAYQSLTASPLRINFGWRGNQSQIVDVDARYVTWGMVFTGGWFSVEISTDGGITYVTADETTIYGSTSGLAQAKLRIIPLSPNDPDHNPTGYSEIRLGNITLAANPSVEGVSPLYLQITQDAYDGGLPTNE